MRVNYRTDRIRSYMTSSESSSEEEIIGTDHFLSDHVFKLVHVLLYYIFVVIDFGVISR